MKTTKQLNRLLTRYTIMKKVLLPVLILLLLVSCKKENKIATCNTPHLNGSCITEAATIRLAIVGRWVWLERTVNGKKSTPCSLNRSEKYYLEFLTDGTLYDYLDYSCPLVGKYQISDSGYFSSYLDTLYRNPFVSGTVSICNNYLVIDNTLSDGPKDVYVKE